ncbi:MAG: hypothetical protein JSV80_12845 [Acidobacteriota bacterium]|nr:MAG: hypothetical protein JSV80_12845 [Acidobacteriota bacterium]
MARRPFKLSLATSAAVLSAALLVSTVCGSEFRWHTEFGPAAQIAHRTGHLILIEQTASNCPHCEILHDWWREPEIAALLEGFVLVRRTSDSPYESAVGEYRSAPAEPWILVNDTHGGFLAILAPFPYPPFEIALGGAPTSDILLNFLSDLPKDASRAYALLERFDENADDPKLDLELGHEYRRLGFFHRSSFFLERAAKAAGTVHAEMTAVKARTTLAFDFLEPRQAGKAEDLLSKCLKRQLESEERKRQLFGMVMVKLRQDQRRAARRYLRRLRDEFTDVDFLELAEEPIPPVREGSDPLDLVACSPEEERFEGA